MLAYELKDDGTLDTVVTMRCPDCGRSWDERFTETADYRNDWGDIGHLRDMLEDHGVVCECGTAA